MSDLKECPKCGASVGDWVGKCDCGHVFGARGKKKAKPANGGGGLSLSSLMRVIPWVMIAIGLGWGCNEG